MEEFELEPGEVVIRSVRQHPFVVALRLLPFLILAAVPSLFGAFFSVFGAINPAAGAAFGGLALPAHIVRFFTGFWLLGIWCAAFGLLTRYYLTVWVITNLRIVDIKQRGFFNREVSSFLLIRVQDVTTDVSGFLATVVGFGRLDVETAGSSDRFSMDAISRPEQVRDIIMAQVARLHASDAPKAGV